MTTAARRERRQAELAQRRNARRTRQSTAPSRWRSPIAVFTVAALAMGVVVVALAMLQAPRELAPTAELVSPAATVPTGLAHGRTLGADTAPVTIDVWSDFQCPACRTLAVEIEPSLVASHVVPGTVKLVYRDAAFQGQRGDPSYDESVEAGAAARCAADQGRFWQMHDWLFANWAGENEGAFSAARLAAIAAAAGLDAGAYERCMAAGTQQAAVRGETQQGFAAGVNSTPTLVINGTPYTGAPTVAQLTAWIEAAQR